MCSRSAKRPIGAMRWKCDTTNDVLKIPKLATNLRKLQQDAGRGRLIRPGTDLDASKFSLDSPAF